MIKPFLTTEDTESTEEKQRKLMVSKFRETFI